MSLRIVFMGTPDFAVPSLDVLVKHGYNIVGVITSTDKMGGRGRKQLIQSEVKKYAVAKGLNVLQPSNLKAPEFIEELKALKADLQIIVAFRMLPEVVWNMPRLGTFNLHGSLLPKYRGAAPINWAVIRGEKETGVSTFFLKHEIDSGNLLFQERTKIEENETAGEVYDRLMYIGSSLVLKTVRAIEQKEYTPIIQDESLVTKAQKLYHDKSEIDFNANTATVHNYIRGLSPYPAAWTLLNDKKLKIYRTKKEVDAHSHAPGTFVTDGSKSLKIATRDGFVLIQELQLQGRKRMDVVSFLNGYKFE